MLVRATADTCIACIIHSILATPCRLPLPACLCYAGKAAPVFWTLRKTQRNGVMRARRIGTLPHARRLTHVQREGAATYGNWIHRDRVPSDNNRSGWCRCVGDVQQFIVFFWNRWNGMPVHCVLFGLWCRAFPQPIFLNEIPRYWNCPGWKKKKQTVYCMNCKVCNYFYLELFSWLCLPRINCILPELSVCNRTIHWVKRNDEQRQWTFLPVSECR